MSEDASATAASSPDASTDATRPRFRRAGVRAGAVAAIALAAAFAAWLVVGRDDDESPSVRASPPTLVGTTPSITEARPAVASVARLRAAAASTSVPIYWVGTRSGRRIEFTRAPGGTVFVRYLPPKAHAGDTRRFLTVATYPRAAGFDEVRRASEKPKARTIRLAGGGLAVYSGERPTNVHIGYPGQAYQVEVFAPEPGLVMKLTLSGAVRPVD